jgi:2-polyprenyl-6-methoxyphenol hydroxylase-like FAD-dependent oxidoreductase
MENAPLKPQYDVIISGAGIVGCAAALRLAERGWRVLLVERNRSLPKHLAGELFHPPGVEQLRALGLSDSLLARDAQKVYGFAVFRGPGQDPIHLRYAEVPNSSTHGLGLHHSEVVHVLRTQAAQHPAIHLRYAKVNDLLRDPQGRVCGVTIRDNGDAEQPVRARLVLAADGRHSRLRDLLGLKFTKRFISYSLALSLPASSLPHPGYGHVMLGMPAPALAYPISAGEARILVDVPVDPGTKLQPIIDFAAARSLPFLPPSLRAHALDSIRDARARILLAPNHAISTRRCVVPGAALLGDAAGCTHPLIASGMTIALNDVAELDRALDAERDLDRALALFERRRYRFVRAREMLADALYESFVGDRPGRVAIQNGIFDYWTSSPMGRAWSMGLLSCATSDPLVFVREYLHVAAASVLSVASGRTPFQGIAQRANAIAGVALESFDKLGLFFSMMNRGIIAPPAPSLSPAQQPPPPTRDAA